MRKLKNLGFLSSTEGIDPEFDFSMDGSIIENPEVEKFFALNEEEKKRIIEESFKDEVLFEFERFPEPIPINLSIKKNIEERITNIEYGKNIIKEEKNKIKEDNTKNIKEIGYVDNKKESECPFVKYSILGIFSFIIFILSRENRRQKEGG